jgi:uncharacterized membrane protein
MQFFSTFIVLAITGALDAGYLIYKRAKKHPLVCPIGNDCGAVVGSKWGKIFGIHNDTIGFVFYLGMLGAVFAALNSPERATRIFLFMLIASGGALLFSAFLTAVQMFALKNYCFYCLISALINLLLFINTVVLFSALK